MSRLCCRRGAQARDRAAVKLLLDENLAPRLARALSDLYPGSIHLTECGLRGVPDSQVWEYARENGFVIASKDSDFSQRSSLFGGPPKVVWLRLGNCTTSKAEFVLRNAVARLHAFERSEEEWLGTCLSTTGKMRSEPLGAPPKSSLQCGFSFPSPQPQAGCPPSSSRSLRQGWDSSTLPSSPNLPIHDAKPEKQIEIALLPSQPSALHSLRLAPARSMNSMSWQIHDLGAGQQKSAHAVFVA